MGVRRSVHVPAGAILPVKRPVGSGTKRAVPTMPVPTEEQEQRTLAAWLDLQGLLWMHVPNGGARNHVTGAILKALGVKPGVPDIFVFGSPPAASDHVGVAIELKRRVGGRLSPAQRRWLRDLEERGWYAAVCAGADEAIMLLERLGYGRRR